ncbi:hypothetical protein [Desulfosporosinus orientis]|nr:hypothetical protein [Desulfosporosinus orientis]
MKRSNRVACHAADTAPSDDEKRVLPGWAASPTSALLDEETFSRNECDH